MGRYIIRRILTNIPLLLGITLILFAVMHMMPGGPLAAYTQNPRVRPEDLEKIKHIMGLDQPVWLQYFYWLGSLLVGNLGNSLFTGRPVAEMIIERLPNTVILMGLALGLSILIGVPLGILSAIKQYSPFDFVVTTLAFIGYSLPVFWFGVMLMLLFAAILHWFPAGGMFTIGQEGNFFDLLWHLCLPVAMLSIVSIATWSRYTRSSMLEVVRQEYVRTARAKGLAEAVVIFKHAFRNALIPVITIVALALPGLFGGAIMTETIFAWPGIGRLFFNALGQGDYPILMAILTISACLVVISNLLADITYAAVDPRIRYD
ncbi:MAG: ABC transporter permease [Cyanobacteria bacterium NC_groundwater_1444_Ag_S-0.65um_54_12]|nr:ABC transporter permease [Cyanobacteria bacterium NC_groundwater_1444_Ag_S-0.65um_54_12]